MRWTNSNRDWLVVSTITNFVTYSCWTLLNKYQFTALGTDCPVFSTALQMLIAGGIAIAVSIAAYGRVLSPSTSRIVDFESHMATAMASKSEPQTAAELLLRSGSTPPSSPAPRTMRTILTTQILPLGLARSIDIGCGNAALFLVSVALQQILKSLLPLFVCFLSLVLLRKNSSMFVWLSLVPIVAGSALSALKDGSGSKEHSAAASNAMSSLGVALALISTFGRSLKAVLNSKLLAGSANSLPLKPLEVLALEAPTSGVILLLVSLGAALFSTQQSSSGAAVVASVPREAATICSATTSTGYVWVNVTAGALMFFNQLSYISVIKFSSALTCQVLMNVKMLLLIVVSISIFHTPLSTTNTVGMGVALLGVFAYAFAAHWESLEKRRSEDDRADFRLQSAPPRVVTV